MPTDALSAALSGRDDDFLRALERLHNIYAEAGAFFCRGPGGGGSGWASG